MEQDEHITKRIRTVVLRVGQEFAGMHHEGIFWGDGNVLYRARGLGSGWEHLLESTEYHA